MSSIVVVVVGGIIMTEPSPRECRKGGGAVPAETDGAVVLVLPLVMAVPVTV